MSPEKMAEERKLKDSKMAESLFQAKNRKEKMQRLDRERAAKEQPNDLTLE